jgi:putative endopeptidase
MSGTSPLDPADRDPSADPAVDFFRFANGGWLDANPVPPEYGSWGSFHEVQVRNEDLLHSLLEEARDAAAGTPDAVAGRYYASGMDTEAIEAAGAGPLAPYLARIESVDSVAALRDLAVALHPLATRIFFSMYVAPDFEDSDRYLLYVTQGGLGLPERDYYLRDDDRSRQLREQYLAHIAAQLRNLGLDGGEADSDAAYILAFETELAEVSYTAEQLRDVDLTLNKVARDELGEVMPGFDLAAYLDAVGAGAAPAVNLNNPGFFSSLDEILGKTPVAVLRAYARWHLIRSTASGLSATFEDEAFDFYGRSLGGQQQQKVRWKRVLAAATSEVGEPVSQLYVAAAFSPEAKARCEELVDHLVTAMGESIRSLDWMSDATKQQALEKLAGFSYKIGFPDRWKGTEGLELGDGPWIDNRLSARVFEFGRDMAKLGDPVDETEWAMPAHIVNAYYHPVRNEIAFPAGILQPPFFFAKADDAVNYGAIGSVIGHEITHGFDDQGSRFDSTGNLRNWWTDEDRAEFERRADVVVGQFDRYAVAEDLNVNGRLTLGENIADVGGLSIAFHAFMDALDGAASDGADGLTPQQRFFLSYGTIWRQNYTDEYLRLLVNTDPHAPSMFRCNGALANTPEFAAAFSVEEGPMRRAESDRAEIW